MKAKLARVFGLFVLSLFMALNGTANAGCEKLVGKPINDRQLWVLIQGEWIKFDAVTELPNVGQRRIPFVYVVKTAPLMPDRTGVLVIKSGTRIVPGSARNGSVVRLVRDDAKPVAYCIADGDRDGTSLHFDRTNVDKKAYDEFHDQGLRADRTSGKTGFEKIIKKFHVALKDGPRCTRTDSTLDIYGNWVNQNMRSQFSFDSAIVDAGMNAPYVSLVKATLSWFGGSALAGGSDGFNNQRSEIKPYKTENGSACVQFFATVGPRNFVLRVNDLGARMAGTILSEERRDR